MRRGFTLIELVATIVVLSLLAAVVTPRFFDVSTTSYRSMARAFESQLKEARTAYIGCTGRVPYTFYTWVGLGPGASDQNTMFITQGLRENLADPSAFVYEPTTDIIRLNFRNGLVATYAIDANGTITTTYVGP
jgi:prepilin-type N-terminal cleavage/methylation domain-containing protein